MDTLSGRRHALESSSEHGIRVHLLNGPYVSLSGARIEVPEGSKRLLAFVSIQKGRLERRYVAGLLWPIGDDNRAAGNLRSALWRLRGAGVDVIDADKWSLSLTDGVGVDIDDITGWAERILSNCPRREDYRGVPEKIRALDILPGCYDDWAITERERIRQRILHALEEMSRLLSAQGRFGEAVEAAMASVFSEPLRESAQRALIESHLAEGNLVEARRVFQHYARLIARELGVEPSEDLRSLVRLTRQFRADAEVAHFSMGPNAAPRLPVAASAR